MKWHLPRSKMALASFLVLNLGWAAAVSGDAPTTSEETKGATTVGAEKAARPKRKPVIYIPKSRGRSKTRSAGGTRGAQTLPRISTIAPEHEGLTTRAQPTLYWYISASTDVRIDFTLIEDEATDPLIEITLNGPVQRGIHALRLADFGLELDTGARYSWYVSMIPDPHRRSNDVVAAAALRRVVATAELERALADAVPAYQAYAENGIWYDGISSLDAAIRASPDDPELSAQLVALFEQVGLSVPADYARE